MRRTELIPKLAALVRHGGALRFPLEESGIGKELFGDEREHPGAVRVFGSEHFSHFGEHGDQLFVDVVVTTLRQEGANLFAHLILIQVPTMFVIGARSGCRIRRTCFIPNQNQF